MLLALQQERVMALWRPTAVAIGFHKRTFYPFHSGKAPPRTGRPRAGGGGGGRSVEVGGPEVVASPFSTLPFRHEDALHPCIHAHWRCMLLLRPMA